MSGSSGLKGSETVRIGDGISSTTTTQEIANLAGNGVPITQARSFSGSITATGSVQGDATTITAEVNIITSATAGSGVRALANPTAPFAQFIRNTTTTNVNLWPAVGAQIDAACTNAAVIIVAGGNVTITSVSTTEWTSS